MDYKTNEEARDYFKNAGLTYNDITEGELLALVILITKELKKHRKGENSDMRLTLSKKMNISKNTNSTIKECYLYCNGSYFVKREAISFNSSGFIGFACWASSCNCEPFTTAFIKWVDLIK